MQQSISTPTQETVEGVNGLKIFFRSWRPEEKPRATVVIIPGFNAHSGYYEWVAGQFVTDGLAVYAVDLRAGNRTASAFMSKHSKITSGTLKRSWPS